MARRRSRYTLHFTDRDPIVCLAYSHGGAVSLGEAQRGTFSHVEKGDYRKDARAERAKASGGFTVDQAALKDACDLLGLKLPVKVRQHGRHGSTSGNHRFMSFPPSHDIMVKSYSTAAEASATLWHELCHAMQAERAVAEGRSWEAVSREQRRYPYSRRPIEVEARKLAEDMAGLMLTKPL